MDIHQTSVLYDRNADRLLLRVSTRAGELYALWLTRRLMRRLWPHLAQHVARAQAAAVSPQAVVLPEARAMAAEVVREASLRQADFRTPFDAAPKHQPLGPEPMLVVQVQLTLLGDRQLKLAFADPSGRELTLQLAPQLATGVSELVQQALAQTDWDLGDLTPAATAGTAPPDADTAPGRVLN